MLFRRKFCQANVTFLVERVSRFTMILKRPNRTTARVKGSLVEVMRTLPFKPRKSMPFDRDSEFMDWPQLQAEVGTQKWFCELSTLWQKGTVENTNCRALRWLPREIVPSTISHKHLEVICARLNATRHKCLGWQKPAKFFKEKVLDQAA